MQTIIQDVYHAAETLSKKTHFHDCHQVILILKGAAEFCINGEHLQARAGDVAVFSRYENHSVRVLTEEYERYVLHIDPAVINRKSAVYSLLTDRPAGFRNIIDVSPLMEQIAATFAQLLREHSGTAKLAEEMEQLLVKQLLIAVYRCTAVDLDDTYDDLVVDLKRQFENNCHEPYTLKALAAKYNVSVSSLSHRFQAVAGVSVMEYLQSCRMANAKQMLVETDYSIGQIVESCGFSDNSNFSRAFKKLNGLSPSAFRKQYKAR